MPEKDKTTFELMDTKELANFLEALGDDIKASMEAVAKSINTDKTANLVIPKSSMDKIERAIRSVEEIKNADFKITNMPDFSGVETELKNILSYFKTIKFPDKISIGEMPKIPAPIVNVDLSKIISGFDKLIKQISQTILSAELTNLDKIPMVLSQHAAKGNPSATPIIHNKTLTAASTWYNIDVSDPTVAFIIQCKDAYDIDVKFRESGGDWRIKAGMALNVQGNVSKVYFKSSQAGVIAQVIEIH